jgi:hypothetical protein
MCLAILQAMRSAGALQAYEDEKRRHIARIYRSVAA